MAKFKKTLILSLCTGFIPVGLLLMEAQRIEIWGHEVYEGGIDTGYAHSSIRIYDEGFTRSSPDLVQYDTDGSAYIVMSAHSENGTLTNIYNLVTDTDNSTNSRLSVVTPPDGQSASDFEGNLIGAFSRYPNDISYAALPSPYDVYRNSNSFTAGLLLAVNGNYTPPDTDLYYGFDNPVFPSFFSAE